MHSTFARRPVPFLAVVLLALTPLVAQAGPGPDPHGRTDDPGDLGRMLEHMKYRLELTDDQTQRVHGLMEARQSAFEGLHEQMVAARGALADAIHAQALDEAAIRGAAAAVGAVEADLAVARAALLQEIRSILTAAQLAEMNEMFAEMKAYHQDHPGAPGAQRMHRRHHAPAGAGGS
jgi:Spy/CpxP family protein refolding chaperone